MTIPSQTVSVSELKRAIECRDAKALTALYADDALLQSIDQDNPPSRPRVLEGKQAIAAYYDDVCSRAMSHHIDCAVTNGETLSFTQTCTYPDGATVFCAAMLEIKDGKIARQTVVQAWDS
jgi:ketosteroid isomerase-like protein